MVNNYARLLLVEGIPGIGKSTVLDRVLRRYVSTQEERKLRTILNLTQTHTYGPLAPGEDDGTLTVSQCSDHLDRIVSWLEWLVDSARNERVAKCFILIDTLHLTHCLRPGLLGWEYVTAIDQRLAALGCRLLLLDAEDETIRARTVVARRDSSFIQEYALGRFGRDMEQLVRHFHGERDAFRQMFEDSSMHKMKVAAEGPVEAIASAASDFFWLGP